MAFAPVESAFPKVAAFPQPLTPCRRSPVEYAGGTLNVAGVTDFLRFGVLDPRDLGFPVRSVPAAMPGQGEGG
jgi:hypothetical protein